MTETESFQDKSGREVRVGDFVVYPYQYADLLGLRFGKVIEIRFAPTNEWSSKKVLGIHVRSVDDFSGEPKVLKQRGVLRYRDRVLLANSFIPEAYKKLLEEAK